MRGDNEGRDPHGSAAKGLVKALSAFAVNGKAVDLALG